MTILSDKEIAALAIEHDMISPFADHQTETGIISYGLSSYGYDARLSNEFKIFNKTFNAFSHEYPLVDPKAPNSECFVEVKTDDYIVIPPNSYALARTHEYFRIPRDVLVLCVGKSTYARCGIIVNVTPLEPEWEGHVTLELSNSTSLPAKVYAHEGICQFLFFKGDQSCLRSYKDKAGKYQGQTSITLAKVKS